MSRIFIIHDTSPSRAWLNAVLHASRDALAANNIEFAPFVDWDIWFLHNHNHFWALFPGNGQMSPQHEEWWRMVAETLDAGKNVLFFADSANAHSTAAFRRRLADKIDHDRHTAAYLAIFGAPSIYFEQIYRMSPAQPDPLAPGYYTKNLNSLPTMAADIISLYEEATILANVGDTAISSESSEIVRAVCKFLGLEKGHLPGAEVSHPLFFGSNAGRHIAAALGVRFNAWPRLDEKRCLSILKSLDRQWGEDFAAPLALRREFAAQNAAAARDLALTLGLDAEDLGPSTPFLEQPECVFDKPVSKDQAVAFLEKLLEPEKSALRQRLENDRNILTDDQQVLFDVLQERDGFGHIGEPAVPVSLDVLTMTYKHEKYIAACMEGVLAQKTDFPVRHLVLDHKSPDGTREIIEQYASRYSSIRPVLLSRRQPSENVTGLFVRCNARYAALCDGDDYFTDPTKLQRQVDMLESNPALSMCFHPVAAVFDDGRDPVIYPPLASLPKRRKMEYYLSDLVHGNFIQTNSVVYRWRFANGLPDWFRPDLCPGDWYWHMLHAETGRIGFIPEVMSVYRRHANALYAAAFSGTTADLRRVHGLAQLETCQTCNDHFDDRYYRAFSELATRILMDLFGIGLNDNDDSLFQMAAAKYPRFARDFFHSLKEMTKADRGALRKLKGNN